MNKVWKTETAILFISVGVLEPVETWVLVQVEVFYPSNNSSRRGWGDTSVQVTANIIEYRKVRILSSSIKLNTKVINKLQNLSEFGLQSMARHPFVQCNLRQPFENNSS